jgi:hypothetical protein
MDRIEFDNPGPLERTERIHQAERTRREGRRQKPDKGKEGRGKTEKKDRDSEAGEDQGERGVGGNLDIEA